jgi:hypothetical protein
MGIEVISELQSKIYNICNQLLNDNKLVTTKIVLSILSSQDGCRLNNINEENISGIVNLWRLSKIDPSAKQTANDNIDYNHNIRDYHLLYQKNSKFRKQLVQTKREIQFLKAKIKALNSFHNRQRQELIMRIEGMLYK